MGKKPLFTNKEFTGGQKEYDTFCSGFNSQNNDRLEQEKEAHFKRFASANLGRAREHINPQAKQEVNIFEGEQDIPLAVFGILNDDVEMARIGLESEPNPDITFGPLKDSLVHFAVKSDAAFEMLDLLKEFNVDVNKKNADGETAFFVTAGRDDIHIAHRLISMDADPNLSDNKGTTPINHAIEMRATDMVQYIPGAIMTNQRKETLQDAFTQTLHGEETPVQQTLADHFLFNKVEDKPTLESMDEVLMAAWQQDTETVKSLVDVGFSLEVQDSTGRDPLDIAQLTGNQDLVDFVEEKLESSVRM